ELDVDLRRHRARKLAFDRLVAGDERIEFWLRNHGCANSGCNAGCPVARGRFAGIMLRRGHATEIGREHQICSPSSAANALSRSRIRRLPVGLSISGCMRAAALPALRSSSMALTGPTADGESENER